MRVPQVYAPPVSGGEHVGDPPVLVPGPRCVVTIREEGVLVQRPDGFAPIPLDLPALILLARLDLRPVPLLFPMLDRLAAESGADRDALSQLASDLRMAEVVVEGDRPRHRPALAPPPGPPPEFDLDAGAVSVRTPLVCRLVAGRYEVLDHAGALVAALTAEELHALGAFRRPVPPRQVLAGGAVDGPTLVSLLGRLDAAGLLARAGSPSVAMPDDSRAARVREVFGRHARDQDERERRRLAETGRRRTRVVPVAFDIGTPAGLGMVVANAMAHDGGRLQQVYEFRTDWVWDDDRLDALTAEPAVYLFSDYVWSHARCLEVSAAVKARSPASVTVHGGPEVPRDPALAAAHLAAHPHVDVAVRGEGEVTAAEVLAALAGVIGAAPPDLSALREVEGVTVRVGDEVVHTPDRARISDLDALPSPYLTGLFDVYAGLPDLFATIETNRGCPYGCVFCDWGSATNSRIRRFDLDRVFAEIDWCGRAGVSGLNVADANFGISARDVDVAARVAAVRGATGHPRGLGVSYAKNTVTHLRSIIEVLVGSGVMAQGVLSLQTMDAATLDAIRRSNIRTERYDELAHEMRRAGLPLVVELMIGLPGQTPASVADDLQECIDREVPARVHLTSLLVNSPMNDPAYRAEHRIETLEPVGAGRQAIVVASSTFTREQWAEMNRVRLDGLLFENWGVLRLVSRYVRHETGMREMDLFGWLRAEAGAAGAELPALHALTTLGSSLMAAPASWAVVLAELRSLLVEHLGVVDDDALEAVCRAQLALLPAAGRRFPEVVEVAHDVAAWHAAILDAKGAGRLRDWTEVVAPLRERPAAAFVVDDPDGVCDTRMGINREAALLGMSWELDSPLSRPRLPPAQLQHWVDDAVFGS